MNTKMNGKLITLNTVTGQMTKWLKELPDIGIAHKQDEYELQVAFRSWLAYLEKVKDAVSSDYESLWEKINMEEDTKLTKQEQIILDRDIAYKDYVRTNPKQTLSQMMKISAALASTGAYKKLEDGEITLNTHEIAGLSGCLHYQVYDEACRSVGDTI